MDSGTRRDYQNINSAIIVPRLNISLEDLVICICPAMLGNGIASILSYVSEEIGVFVITTGICGSIILYIFARRKRKEEIGQRGFSRSGVLRRYLAYLLGAEWLRCR
ncbi:MAG: hypothetical protein A4E61_00593 [Syntrophorhabdus sp. PtaB.Bin184]|jgi:uncharacterized membrane protein YfcA|nr:MAG: hypothetical protein A4E61_00593 [Syntrophorhabdus sp. PtaB.Bin184]